MKWPVVVMWTVQSQCTPFVFKNACSAGVAFIDISYICDKDHLTTVSRHTAFSHAHSSCSCTVKSRSIIKHIHVHRRKQLMQVVVMKRGCQVTLSISSIHNMFFFSRLSVLLYYDSRLNSCVHFGVCTTTVINPAFSKQIVLLHCFTVHFIVWYKSLVSHDAVRTKLCAGIYIQKNNKNTQL